MKEYLQQIRFSAYDMNRIIDNLLLFAEVSKAEAPVELVDMARVVANIRKRLNFMIEERQAKIELPEAWPWPSATRPGSKRLGKLPQQCHQAWRRPPRVELGASPSGTDGALLDA